MPLSRPAAGRHIAMIGCTTPSHVLPSLGVVAELVRRGHRVSYAIGDRLAGLVAGSGAAPITYPSTLPADDGDWPDNPVVELPTRLFLNEAISTTDPIVKHLDGDRPDLVLYDVAAMAGPMVGERLGVPVVQLAPTWVPWEGFEQDNAAALAATHLSADGLTYYGAYGAWLADNGVDADPWLWMASPRPTIALIPRLLQPHADRMRPDVHFVGPCLDPARLAARTWTPPPGTRRTLLVSLGTVFNDRPDVYRVAAAAFADTDWQVVMAVGKRLDPAGLGPLPANVEAYREVPQLDVLAEASAFVTHAGMGGCVETLWFGVPAVTIPLAAEQFGNAAILDALGISRQLAADQLTPALLRAAVEDLVSSSVIAERLALLRTAVRSSGGVEVAADAVESFLP
ncbi:macrolide family glycosyltransferase [Frankia sp. R82]|uniref:macrolide family glycosyltransferase n=1 Tax=Frankia sp. R82 TaxID=2950553 RepID=UPI002043B7DB|nr:macrolide family glycosyltransferase [Frankia sp. R82]MCM3885655.1 UDP glycosyltransferase [Frankia sp. R82]